jgi:copper chaperone CopZ
MATKDEIKKAILEVAGNPESGSVFNLAGKWADAIVALDTAKVDLDAVKGEGEVVQTAKFDRPAKETRITKAEETR